MTVTNKTMRLLDEAAAVSGSDLFVTRQGTDTKDKKQTLEAILAYVQENVSTVTGRIVTAAGAVTIGSGDQIVEIAKAAPQATTVNIPDGLPAFKVFTVKDGGLNSSIYPITLVPESGEIDGSAYFIMETDGQSISFYSNGADIRIV